MTMSKETKKQLSFRDLVFDGAYIYGMDMCFLYAILLNFWTQTTSG